MDVKKPSRFVKTFKHSEKKWQEINKNKPFFGYISRHGTISQNVHRVIRDERLVTQTYETENKSEIRIKVYL